MNIVIVGAGEFGSTLAETLAGEDNNIKVVDMNDSRLARLAGRVDVLTILGNGVQLGLLETLDMKTTDLVVATTTDDETNVVICHMAKRLGCPRVAARVRSPEYADQIGFFKDQFEIDFIANPELDTALDISRYVLRGYAAHMQSFAQGRVSLFDVQVSALPHLIGKRLAEVDFFHGMLVVAIYRDGEVIVPSGTTELRLQDVLYLMGKRETLTSFARELPNVGERHVTRKVMILGGGTTGYYLAQRLLVNGLAVKIVERSEERCNYLVSRLKGALVLCGDCTDLELLQDENLGEMDAIISLTGNDEENIMLSLLAKQHGVPKVVAKVGRSNFVPLVEQLGIDRAVNPVLISAGEVTRFIQGGAIASLSLMFGGQAEAVEIIVPEGAAIIGRPLAEARIPQGMIVGAIVRNQQVLIPSGRSVIETGDRVIVFCLRNEIPALQKFFYTKKRGFLYELWHGGKGHRKPPTT